MGSREMLAAAVARLQCTDAPPLHVSLELDRANSRILFRIGRDEVQLEQPMEIDEVEDLISGLQRGLAMLRGGSANA